MTGKLVYLLILSLAEGDGCKKSFAPTVTSVNSNALVVEGLIKVGTDSTMIKLSRIVLVDSKTTANLETKANLTVENTKGMSYNLPETAVEGTYAAAAWRLDNTLQYRLRIRPATSKTYLSDFVDAKITSPIDYVGFSIKNNGVQIYANAHDATNKTLYYKYAYRETWQFHAHYMTNFISNGKSTTTERLPSQQIYYCSGPYTSTNVILNSNQSLSQDVVYQFPITLVNNTSEQIETRYSILLSLQTLTADAVEFCENLKKNTQTLGSIFDAQPSQLIGNVRTITDPSEPVIGYISAGTAHKKRIYITKSQLQQNWRVVYPVSCELGAAVITPCPLGATFYVTYNGVKYQALCWEAYIINNAMHGYEIQQIVHGSSYLIANVACADCTIRGTTKNPSFWQ